MKRALAERAKQSGIPNGDVVAPGVSTIQQEKTPPTDGPEIRAPPPPMSSVPTSTRIQDTVYGTLSAPPISAKEEPPQAPPLLQHPNLTKVVIPKQEDRTYSHTNASSATGTPATPSSSTNKPVRSPRPSPSPRPKKRLRDSTAAEKFKQLQEEDEVDDSSASAFYLKHQNRALASELRSVKYQLSRLERERDYRRSQCSEALQSINSVSSIWRQLESSMGKDEPSSSSLSCLSSGGSAEMTPPSTGLGTSAEMIGAFLHSLERLGDASRSKVRGEIDMGEEKKSIVNAEDKMDVDGEDLDESQQEVSNDLLQLSENFAERMAVLQSWIWSLLKKVEKIPSMNGTVVLPPAATELQETVTRLEAENLSLQQRIEELARSRDEITESDRRVRRGLYRLAAGRMQLKEVLKAIASADGDKEAAAAWMDPGPTTTSESAIAKSTSSASVANLSNDKAATDDNKEAPASSEEVAQLKKQVAELNEVAAARDDQIQQLLSEREDHQRRINALILKEDDTPENVMSSADVKQSDLYLQLSAELAAKERNLVELENKSNRIKEEWSQALANAELSKQAMEDLQSKHLKRWAELAEENPDIGPADEGGKVDGVTKAEEIVTLQHKLTQALENVRQASSTRKTLDEAMAMNDSLQAKVDEFKSKYSALQAEKAARTGNAAESTDGNGVSGAIAGAKGKSGDSSAAPEKGDRSSDKLHRDYKRARKELAAATASKEAAKAKLERAEKEKDFLSQQNSRLLKQSAEKDEINAKSLSTILHLKQLTEQVAKEKENLELQVKSAEQLALAARLASNARERVAEEFEKERKILEDRVKEWEQKCNDLAKEKDFMEGRLSQEKAKMSKLIGDAQKAKERCEELASESTKLQEEKQKMMESLAIAQREATEASSLTQRLAESQGGGMVAGFTAEQLNTQVTVLKNRLACPVCNVRDKKCILLRCRHMFCKQCVDENVKNRSRKCPACGGRFDTKDVADVWL